MKTVQRFLCIACLVGASHAVEASNPKVDSLLQVLQSDPRDRAEVLWGIAYELFDVDNVQALFYAERAYQEVWKRGDSLQIVKVGTTYGQLLRRMDEVTKSIEVSELILTIANRHDYRKYTKMLLNSLGVSFIEREEFDKALGHSLESLTLRELDGDIEEIGIALSNVGLIHYKLGDYELAIEYMNKAMKSNGRQTTLINLYNLGFCHLGLRNFSESLKYFQRALGFMKGGTNVRNHRAIIEHGFAETYSSLGLIDSARVHCLKSQKLAEEISGQRLMIFNLILLAKLSRLESDLAECNKYLGLAEAQDALNEYPRATTEIYRERSKYFYELGNYRKAADYLIKHDEMDEAIRTDESAARIRAINASYAQRENMTTIKAQAQVLALKDEAILGQQKIIGLFSGIVILSIWITWLLRRSNEKTKRINRMLDERVHERTVELGANRSSSQHSQDEQTFLKRKVAEEVLSAVATLRGISYLGQKDLPSEYLPYFDQARSTADKIEGAVSRLRT